MRKLFGTLFLLLCFGLYSAGLAQTPSPNDQDQFKNIISHQLEAFKADKGAEAYSYAAPAVQQIFPNVESFMGMVQRGYPQVFRNQGYEFGALSQDVAGRPVQEVRITGLDGEHYLAAYTLQQQTDGSWKIAACTMMKIEGIGV